MNRGKRTTDPVRRLTRHYIFNQTSHWFLIGLLIPVSTIFQMEKGNDLFMVGLFGAVYSLTVVAMELPTGGLADAIGRIRIYRVSLLFLSASGAVLIIAWNGALMIAGMVLLGVARALFSGSIDAWFVDEFYRIAPREHLQEALAVSNVWIPLGLGAAALTGGLLPTFPGGLIERSLGITRYSANLFVMVPLAIIHRVVTSLILEEHRESTPYTGVRHALSDVINTIRRSVTIGFGNRAIFLMLLGALAWGVGFSGLETYWQPRFRTVAAEYFRPAYLGILTAAYFIAGSAGSALSMRYTALFHGNRIRGLAVARLLQGLLLVLLILQTGPLGFAVFYVVVFLANGIQNPLEMSLYHEYVPERERSTLLSFSSLFMQGGAGAGLVVIGYLADSVSIQAAWGVSAGILIISATAYALLPRP